MYCFEVKDTFLVFISCKSTDSLKKPSGRDRRGRGGGDRWVERSQAEEMLNKESTIWTIGEQRQKQSEVWRLSCLRNFQHTLRTIIEDSFPNFSISFSEH